MLRYPRRHDAWPPDAQPLPSRLKYLPFRQFGHRQALLINGLHPTHISKLHATSHPFLLLFCFARCWTPPGSSEHPIMTWSWDIALRAPILPVQYIFTKDMARLTRIFNLLVLLHIFNAAPTQHTPRLRRSWLGGSRTVNPGYSHQARLELSWPTRQFDLL